MTDVNRTRFNAEAAAWDQNPDVHLASRNALEAILRAHPRLRDEGTKTVDVLEVGCGTGLLTIPLAPYVHSILAIDASSGMVDALSTKLSSPTSPTNITPLSILLEDPSDPRLPIPNQKFDLAISHLTLHHIPSMTVFLHTLYGCLKPGTGEVLITDFEDFGAEARKFHPEGKMGGVERDGIRREEIERILGTVGFVDVEVQAGWKQWKAVEDVAGAWGEKGERPAGWEGGMEFPFLVMRGRRPGKAASG